MPGRRVELVAFDVEVVSARVGHGFREGRHDAASPAAERNPVVRGEAVGGIAQGVCLRCHMVEPGHRAVDELARCRGVFEDRGDGLLDLRGRGLFAGIAGGEKKRRERECIFIHVFHNFYGFGRDSARVFPGLAGARAPAPPPPRAFSPRRRGAVRNCTGRPAYDPPQGGTGPRRGVGLPACPERDKNTLFSAYGSRDTGKKPGFRKKD